MRRKKNMKLIYVLLAGVILMVTGYALLTATIEVTGSATAGATFDIVWNNPVITANPGASTTGAPALTSGDTVLTIDPVLDYAGAYVEVTVDIKNQGTLDAIITALTPTEPVGSDILWSVTPTFAVDQTLASAATLTGVVIKVEWDIDSTNEGPINETFGIVVEYTQDT